jgi:hypothetical protein
MKFCFSGRLDAETVISNIFPFTNFYLAEGFVYI